jgi:hypothetical protein
MGSDRSDQSVTQGDPGLIALQPKALLPVAVSTDRTVRRWRLESASGVRGRASIETLRDEDGWLRFLLPQPASESSREPIQHPR